MHDAPYTILFLCSGNSCRSIMAEALTNHLSKGKFIAFSAGSKPKGYVVPMALQTLQDRGIATEGLRSKSWDEYSQPGATSFDFVFTLCDQAAAEPCPIFPGQPIKAHWGMQDPSDIAGDEHIKKLKFNETAVLLECWVDILMKLPLASLDMLAIQHQVDTIKSQVQ